MTVREILKETKSILFENDIDNSQNEAYFIVGKALGMKKSDMILNGNVDVGEDKAKKIHEMTEKRLSGKPVQYCIGEWDFYGETYKVGEGVLIPRPETEELCEAVINELKSVESPTVIDLCSGSGCIGLTIKKNTQDATVFLVEKSREALKYLIENADNVCRNEFVSIINGDVLKPLEFEETFDKVDAIISNPPYIKSAEIASLQSEVQHEPKMALDGGEDGYDFYRVICTQWTDYLKDGGFVALECGEEQAEYICSLFDESEFETEIIKDFNNIDRFVIGRKKLK